MSDVPIHVKILASLGIAKVKVKKETTPKRRTKRSFSLPDIAFGFKIPMLLFMVVITALALGAFDFGDEDTIKEEPSRALAMKIAEGEGKNDWEDKQWSNPDTAQRLADLKIEIDNADCLVLKEMLGHERWTQRAYVAHTFIEKGCL
jgi:hypothetical protein